MRALSALSVHPIGKIDPYVIQGCTCVTFPDKASALFDLTPPSLGSCCD
jgi:hypothetical protein